MAEVVERVLRRMRRSTLAREVQGRYSAPLRPEKWVFVIGCYDSGTTLLGSILASHPQAAGFDAEGVAYTDGLPWPENSGWTRMWIKCEREMRIAEGASAARRAERIKRQWGACARERRPEVFVEKSVANVCRIGFLEKHFRPAYFVHIVRNGFAVAEGIRRKAVPSKWGGPTRYPDGYPIDLCARQWARSEEVVEEARNGTERLLTITYEDLCEDPAKVLSRITEFLGVRPFSAEVSGKEWTVQGATSAIKNRNASSFERLDDADREEIVRVAGDMLERRGYLSP